MAKIKNTKKFAENINNGDSSDEDTKDCLDEDLISSVFKNFQGNPIDLEKTRIFLDNCFQSGNLTCLICLRFIKNSDKVNSIF